MSLAELIVAMGILVTGFMLLVPLMQYAISYSSEVNKSTRASQIAESKLNELRAWAVQPGPQGFQFENLDNYPQDEVPDSHYPDFLVSVRTQVQVLVSPNLLLESVYPQPRTMNSSAYKVGVKVTWPSFGRRASLELFSLIGAPTRRFRRIDPIQVGATTGTTALPKDGTLDFTVKAFDEDDNEIKDLFFSWAVERRTGSGSFSSVARDGREATFQNRSRTARGGAFYTGGTCQVKAIATYRGEERWGTSVDISLQN